MKYSKRNHSWAAGLVLVALFSFALIAPQAVFAGTQDLPPRPNPEPKAPAGGLITLVSTTPVGAEYWTRIQWQDLQGDWHDVDGWQGTFNHDGEVIWWVAPEDLDTGPFRWLAYAKQGDGMVFISNAFSLPSHAGQMVTVDITILP